MSVGGKVRKSEIERENERLLQRLARIIASPSRQQEPCRTLPSRSRSVDNVKRENAVYTKRLAEIKPYYNRQLWSKDRSEQEKILKRINKWPPHSKSVTPPPEPVVEKKKKIVAYRAPPPRVRTCRSRKKPTPPSTELVRPQEEVAVVAQAPSPAAPEEVDEKVDEPEDNIQNTIEKTLTDESSKDQGIMSTVTSTASCVLFGQRLRTTSGVVAGGRAQLVVTLEASEIARIATRMPSIALVDPDATINFINSLAHSSLRQIEQQCSSLSKDEQRTLAEHTAAAIRRNVVRRREADEEE